MPFICSPCSRKSNMSLEDRILMSQRIKFGNNVCSDCGSDFVFNIKPIERAKPSVQMGLFVGFNP